MMRKAAYEKAWLVLSLGPVGPRADFAGTSAGPLPGPRPRPPGTDIAITGFRPVPVIVFPATGIEHVRLHTVARNRDSQCTAYPRPVRLIGQVGPARRVRSKSTPFWGQTGFIDSNNGPVASPARKSAVQCGLCNGNESSLTQHGHPGQLPGQWPTPEFPMPLVPFATSCVSARSPFATAATYKLAAYANGDLRRELLHTSAHL